MRHFESDRPSWAFDTVPSGGGGTSTRSLPYGTDYSDSNASDTEEYIVTLDFQDDDTVILRSVEPANATTSTIINIDTIDNKSDVDNADVETTVSDSRLRWSSSNLKTEMVAKARQFSQDLKAEFRRFSSWSSHGSFQGGGGGVDSALAARAMRQQRAQLDRTRSGAHKALRGLRFISKTKTNDGLDAWNEVQDNFNELAKDGYLYRVDFAQCIGMKDSKEFALEVFDALSRRRRLKVEKISRDELQEYWKKINDQSFDSRLEIFFDMVDKNIDGRVTEQEVKEIIMLSASANKLSRLKEQAEEYAALVMEELDPEGLGYIELWQLETLLLQKDTYLNYSQALSYTSQALSQSLAGLRKNGPINKVTTKLIYYFQEYWRRIWVITLWVLIMVGLFTWKFIQYTQKDAFMIMGYCLPTAKGAGETLKFNMALILLPVCKNIITWLRSTKLGYLVPFDDNINFHKLVSAAIVIGVVLHAGDHLACDFPRLISSTDYTYNLYLTDAFGQQKPTYVDLIKGVEGVTGLIMVTCMTISFTFATKWFRRSLLKLPKPLDKLTGFNAFWYSHHLLILVYIMLIVHGQFLYLVHDWYHQTTWMYLSVPVLLYAGERALRFWRSGFYPASIHEVAIYPGDVLKLEIFKPPQFKYKSGQYMFVQCPLVSPFEWHPFSITSAPGDDFLSIHIRQLGDWTQELKRVFAEACEPPLAGKSGILRADVTTETSLPRLLIDGPYGAPAQDYSKYDVLLLVGLGIGATPFISILKDLLNNIVQVEEMDSPLFDYSSNSDQGVTSDETSSSKVVSTKHKKMLRTTNAYFYWVTKEQGSFDWFKGVTNEVADLDQRGVIEMHNYLTSVYEEGDARSALITMVQTLNHAKNGVDVVSGTRMRTHFARPNWKKVFARICTKHANARIGVFYCGAKVLAKELNELCHEFNQKRTTRFEFHKENF